MTIKEKIGKSENSEILIFNDSTGKVIDFNFQGTKKDVKKRLEIFTQSSPKVAENADSTGPGRPKLGVVSREISLLPRHWEWLASQSGGASSTLRKLVEEAKKKSQSSNSVKRAQECTYKFMNVMAGDLPGFEEALRALYQKNRDQFLAQMKDWPKDVRKHAAELAAPVFSGLAE